MAKVNSEQGFVIRHRLVGAIVLLTLAVIFIPMLLQGNGPGGDRGSGKLTEEVQEWIVETENSKTYTSRVKAIETSDSNQGSQNIAIDPDAEPELLVVEDSAPQSAQQPAKVQMQETQSDQITALTDQPVSIAEPAVEVKKTSPKKETSTEVASNSFKAQKVDRGWILQVGTFSKTDNAKNLMAKLSAIGFDSNNEVINTSSGQATRVWVGPYEKRVTAGRALERVKEKLSVNGLIKAYP